MLLHVSIPNVSFGMETYRSLIIYIFIIIVPSLVDLQIKNARYMYYNYIFYVCVLFTCQILVFITSFYIIFLHTSRHHEVDNLTYFHAH